MDNPHSSKRGRQRTEWKVAFIRTSTEHSPVDNESRWMRLRQDENSRRRRKHSSYAIYGTNCYEFAEEGITIIDRARPSSQEQRKATSHELKRSSVEGL